MRMQPHISIDPPTSPDHSCYMSDESFSDYFCYIPENRICRALGCTLVSSGHTRVGRHSSYPVAVHPKDHHFHWQRGRILRAHQIVYISHGKGRLEWGPDRREQKVAAGSVFVLFPGVWHRYAPDTAQGWTEHWVECVGTAFQMAGNTGLLDVNRPYYDAPDTAALDRTFAEIHGLATTDAIGNQPVLSMLGLKLLALLAAPRDLAADKTARLVDAARMLLMESCADNRPMEAIAAELGVSYSFLRRGFREITGLSMKEFQISIRIQRAQDMLDNSDLSVKEIAGRLGFSSAFHFSSQFASIVGRAPTAWRAREVISTP